MNSINKVIKVGGSCLSRPESVMNLSLFLKNNKKDSFVVVVSAFKGVTNLIERWFDDRDVVALQEILSLHKFFFETLLPKCHFLVDFPEFEELKNIHLNRVDRNEALSLGEKMSSSLIARYLQEQGVDIVQDPRDPFVFGNQDFYDFDQSSREIEKFSLQRKHNHILTQGFSSWDKGNKSNLGREGSDLTAVIWARSLGAECILYKDVGALYTGDPHINADAEKIESISFSQYQKNFFGAGVVYDKVIDFCIDHEQGLSIASFDKNTLGTEFVIEKKPR